MNCKTKRKSWRRLARCAAGGPLPADRQRALCWPRRRQARLPRPRALQGPEKICIHPPKTPPPTPGFSFTVLDADYEAPASGNLDESLFAIKADEARMPTGEVVPVLLQVADPAPGSSVTVTLSGRGCLYRFQDGGRHGARPIPVLSPTGNKPLPGCCMCGRTATSPPKRPMPVWMVKPSPARSRSLGIPSSRRFPPFRREPVNTSTTSPT